MTDIERYLRALGISLSVHGALAGAAFWLWNRPPQKTAPLSVLWEVDLSSPVRTAPAVPERIPPEPDLRPEPPLAATLSEPSIAPPGAATGAASGPADPGQSSAGAAPAFDMARLFPPVGGGTIAFPMAGNPGTPPHLPSTNASSGGGGTPESLGPLGAQLAAIVRIPPTYPLEARRRKIEGWVRMELTVLEDGSVTDVRVKSAEPAGIFEQAAMAAITRWKFRPAMENGKPVRKRAAQTLRFELNR